MLRSDVALPKSRPAAVGFGFPIDKIIEADYIDSTDEQFNYDDLGNRLTLNTRGDQDVAYLHNVANEYTSIGGQSVSHDAAGNLSADDNGYTYEYDHDNRLTKIKKNSGSTTVSEFTYDALGRRIEKIEYDTTNITTRYYYDGWRVLSETNAAGVNQRDYVYGNYLDEVLIKRQDSADLYYAHNHLYSPVALIESDGTVVERYEYDAYGKPTIYNDDFSQTYDTSQHDNPVMFTGQRIDSLDSGDLQLMYYKNRNYCTTTGRFLQRDPIGVQNALALVKFNLKGNTSFHYTMYFNQQYADGMNLFEYVNSVPITNVDKFGLMPMSCYGAGFGHKMYDEKCCTKKIGYCIERKYLSCGNCPKGYTEDRLDVCSCLKRGRELYNQATIDSRNESLSWPRHGKQNAYRHCYASCLITQTDRFWNL